MTTDTDTIRALNDRLRKDFSTGHAVITAGVAALGAEAVARIVKTIAVYDDFCQANDPYEEHDFGAVRRRRSRDLFQDRLLREDASDCHSPDPADPSVTERIMTVMLAEE